MTMMETILSRRSIRSYTGEQISDRELQTILQAAEASPVGMGAYETLALTVIRSEELLKKIDANAQKVFGREGQVLYGAPTLILISTKLQNNPMDSVAYSNAAIIAQNIALAAVDLGVGACHIWGAISALRGNPELVKEIGIKGDKVPFCAVDLGKTEEVYTQRVIDMDRISIQYID